MAELLPYPHAGSPTLAGLGHMETCRPSLPRYHCTPSSAGTCPWQAGRRAKQSVVHKPPEWWPPLLILLPFMLNEHHGPT